MYVYTFTNHFVRLQPNTKHSYFLKLQGMTSDWTYSWQAEENEEIGQLLLIFSQGLSSVFGCYEFRSAVLLFPEFGI